MKTQCYFSTDIADNLTCCKDGEFTFNGYPINPCPEFPCEEYKTIVKDIETGRKIGEGKLCPVCEAEPVVSCSCSRHDSFCPKGHAWHMCTVHHVPVVGPSDHGSPTMTCTCKKGEESCRSSKTK